MSSRITKGEFELATRIFREHLGEVIQYIAESVFAQCKCKEDVPEQLGKVSLWKEEDLKFKIWKACDSLEIFLPYIEANEYWKAEEALDMLWSDKTTNILGKSGYLHGFDIRPMISTMVLNLYYIKKNKEKVEESLK